MSEKKTPFPVFMRKGQIMNLNVGGRLKKFYGETKTNPHTREEYPVPTLVEDREVIRTLLKYPGTSLFNAQDAVDFGWLSAEEVSKLGYDVVVRTTPEEDDIPVPADLPDVPPDPEHPDLFKMTIPELMDIAEERKVVLKRNMHKEEMVKALYEDMGIDPNKATS